MRQIFELKYSLKLSKTKNHKPLGIVLPSVDIRFHHNSNKRITAMPTFQWIQSQAEFFLCFCFCSMEKSTGPKLNGPKKYFSKQV